MSFSKKFEKIDGVRTWLYSVFDAESPFFTLVF